MNGPASAVDHFAARGGFALLRRRWAPERATRALAIVHGLAEHSERYEATASWFAARGFACFAFDQRGHGASEGPRAHAPSFELLLDDLERFLASVHGDVPSLPLTLLGHSMGGLEVAWLLATRRTTVAAAVLSGPALGIADALPRARQHAAALLGRIASRLPIPRPVDPTLLSRDPAVVEAYVRDERIPKYVTAGLAAELLRAARGALALAPQVAVPLLIVHGEADAVCPLEASRRFVERMPPGAGELRSYPGVCHELLNEPEREQILREVQAWIEKRVQPAGSA